MTCHDLLCQVRNTSLFVSQTTYSGNPSANAASVMDFDIDAKTGKVGRMIGSGDPFRSLKCSIKSSAQSSVRSRDCYLLCGGVIYPHLPRIHAPVDLPVKLPSFVCLVIGACCSVLALTCFSPGFYGVVSPATCVERLLLR